MTYEKAYNFIGTWVAPAFVVLWFIGLFNNETLRTIGYTGALWSIIIQFAIVAFVLYPREQAKARLYKIYWDAWEDEKALERAKAFVASTRGRS